ncbi:OB-fold domain-containing protein [uncultured Sphingomonas sp.]|uniref:Zn-ribbon domain-containing OB-fold protein n=1 Tax=uncultured Sphingomonas sp. TaxID=158754 RepID=UPI00262DAFC9|nr:OB-fold domain-containing protein [uncultured Sphingomonas sp.]
MARAVAEGLFIGEGAATRLLAGKSRQTGRLRFPLPAGAGADDYETVELAPEGRLWSYTIQRFRPKTPFNGDGDEQNFKPYGVGYVELPGQLIVESRLVANDLESLRIGEPMRITTEAYRTDESGEPVLTYAFAPVREGEAA